MRKVTYRDKEAEEDKVLQANDRDFDRFHCPSTGHHLRARQCIAEHMLAEHGWETLFLANQKFFLSKLQLRNNRGRSLEQVRHLADFGCIVLGTMLLTADSEAGCVHRSH